jgi:hypothetical protein
LPGTAGRGRGSRASGARPAASGDGVPREPGVRSPRPPDSHESDHLALRSKQATGCGAEAAGAGASGAAVDNGVQTPNALARPRQMPPCRFSIIPAVLPE